MNKELEKLEIDLKDRVTTREWLFYILLSTLSYVWVEFFSSSQVGIVLSIVVLISLTFYFLNGGRNYIFYVLLIVFLIPEYPRDILFSYDDLSSGDRIYNTFNSVKIGGLTTLQILLIGCGFLSLLLYKRAKVFNVYFLIFICSLFCLLFIRTLVNNEYVNLSAFITNIKLYIIGFFFLLTLGKFDVDIIKRNLKLFLRVYPVLAGFRIPLFLGGDLLMGIDLSFDFFTHPIVSAICFIYVITQGYSQDFKHSSYRLFFYLSLISSSRAVMAISFLLIVLGFLFKGAGKVKARFFFEVVPLLISLVVVIGQVSPAFYNFLAWKVSEFNFLDEKEMSGSGRVRQYEIVNILAGDGASLGNIVFGRGASGSFNFDSFPIPIKEQLDSKSFTPNEVESNAYLFPHSFIASNLLRGGVVLLIIYVFVHVFLSYSFYKRGEFAFSVLSIVLIYNSYVRIEYFLFFVCIASIHLFEKRCYSRE